jgi:F-type H+-transporting ATPase subunit b
VNAIITNSLLVVASTAGAGAEAGSGGGASALIPKMAEFIPGVIAFSVVYLVLSKFAWPAISDMLDKRAETIRESLERAEQAKVEAERLLAEYKQAMADARKEASTVLQQAKQSAESTRAEAQARAQAEYDDMIAKARQAIEGEKQAAISELQSSVANLSVAVAAKLIGSELSGDDHLKVVEKYLDEAGSLNAN